MPSSCGGLLLVDPAAAQVWRLGPQVGDELTEDEIRRGLRKGTLKGRIVPVFAGSALKNIGVQQVLDAVVLYLPSPVDVPAVVGINPYTEKEESREAADAEPLAALAFTPLPVETGILLGLFLVAVMPSTLSSGVVMTTCGSWPSASWSCRPTSRLNF